MKQIKKSGLAIIALLMSMGATAENEITNETVYKAEAFGSVATDENTPVILMQVYSIIRRSANFTGLQASM